MLRLDDAICLTDSLILTLNDCVNFKAMRYESRSFNRIVADKSHHVKPGLLLSGRSFVFIHSRLYRVSQKHLQECGAHKTPFLNTFT